MTDTIKNKSYYLAKVLYYVLRLLVRDVENQIGDALRKVRANVEGFIWASHDDHMCDANLRQLLFLNQVIDVIKQFTKQ